MKLIDWILIAYRPRGYFPFSRLLTLSLTLDKSTPTEISQLNSSTRGIFFASHKKFSFRLGIFFLYSNFQFFSRFSDYKSFFQFFLFFDNNYGWGEKTFSYFHIDTLNYTEMRQPKNWLRNTRWEPNFESQRNNTYFYEKVLFTS